MKSYTRRTKIGSRTLFFTASWCPPCAAMKTALARPSAETVADKLLLVDIDSPAGEELAAKHHVRSIPTFVRPDGKTEVGGMPVRDLAKWISASE